jgi:hypothetical protein
MLGTYKSDNLEGEKWIIHIFKTESETINIKNLES